MASAGMAVLTYQFLNEGEKRSYERYRSKHYDGVVRDDIIQVCATFNPTVLDTKECPFPGGAHWKRKNFLQRHKIFSGLLLTTIVLDIAQVALLRAFGVNIYRIDFFENLQTIAGMGTAFVLAGIVYMAVGKFLGGRRKKYIEELGEEGNAYWNMREYVREALDMGVLTQSQALQKLMNTMLYQRHAYRGDDLEADVFHYQRAHGLLAEGDWTSD